ncbi:MAG: 5,10-methylenetetrahydrofolate reductase [Alphaproteobacteria bacterium MarineAlpha9_Bin1]|nr:MAG: 5,10-methylenetetrahydrofolate reductase [Alphaproteobacteria bacterium MarineAlpha9_Bin1]
MGLGIKNKNISLEIYPFMKGGNNDKLCKNLKVFEKFKPKFVSVTYGASGSIQNNTVSLLTKISQNTCLNLAAHLTCVNSSKIFIHKILSYYWNNNIKNIVALGGDLPKISIKSEYNHAYELIKDIKKNNTFNISVAFHPEGHPDDKNIMKEIEYLRLKFDCGASQAISQFFFNIEYFLKFRDLINKKQSNIKLIPGIILISNFEMIERFARKCRTDIPESEKKIFSSIKDKTNIPVKVTVEYAYNLCLRLKSEGVQDFHIYTLNKLDTSLKLINELQ